MTAAALAFIVGAAGADEGLIDKGGVATKHAVHIVEDTISGDASTPVDSVASWRRQLNARCRELDAMSNLTCSVDVVLIERDRQPPEQTVVKESWLLERNGETNRFTRDVFTPMRTTEIITAHALTGGIFEAGDQSVALPSDYVMPPLEMRHFLEQLRTISFVVTTNAGVITLSGQIDDDGWLANFTDHDSLPFQMIRSQHGNPVWKLTRTGGAHAALPMRESVHLYREGRVVRTIIRTYSSVQTNSPQCSAEMYASEQEEKTP